MSRDLTTAEASLIDELRIGRLATVDRAGAPQVNPVSCYYNPGRRSIDIGGHNMAGSRKYRNASLPGARAALVIDEIRDGDPATIRLLELRGPVEAIADPSDSAAQVDGPIIRLRRPDSQLVLIGAAHARQDRGEPRRSDQSPHVGGPAAPRPRT